MTEIDFYQIESNEKPLFFTCRLIDKIYHQGLPVHIHTANQAQAEELDDLLWTFKPDRFIPHAIYGVEDDAPVKIHFDQVPTEHDEVLVNLSGQVPDFFSRFKRVAEVVPLDKNSRNGARENYKFYQDRGYTLRYHKMQTTKIKA